MTSYLRYEFLGYEHSKSQADDEAMRPGRSRRANRLRHWCSKLGRSFANWMLEPIDYPLKMRGESTDRVART